VKNDSKVATGYALAVSAAAISGVAIIVNSLGVKLFKDSATYTTLKNGVVGLLVLVPFFAMSASRVELGRLSRRQWGWLAVLAVISGSVPFLLFFEGLRQTDAVTGALFNHLQFALVAVLAAILLRERISAPMWLGFAALVVATNIGINLGAVRVNTGTALLLASTTLFAAGFVLAKHLLAGLSTMTVMSARMTLGSLVLLVYLAATGRLGAIGHLHADQWQFVIVTGLILFAFVATTLAAIKRVPVSAVMAIGMASPLVTTVLEAAHDGRLRLNPADLANLGFTVAVITAIVVIGLGEARRTPTPVPSPA
jgi:drug/metabolite transporter (DMT)-like permease